VNPTKQFGEICRSEALLAEAEVLANLGSWEHDLETNTIFQSANLWRMLGTDPRSTSISEETFWLMVDPNDHEGVREAIKRATGAHEPYEYQARFVLPDGRRRVFLVRGKPVVDPHNRVVKRIGVAMDVTERMEFVQAIRQSAELYRDLVENSHALICTHDLEGRLLSMNDLPARILGYRARDLIGRRIPDMLPADGQALYAEYVARIKREGHAEGLMALKTRSGERRIWEYHNTLRLDGVPAPVVRGMAHDITERFEGEKKLRKSEALLAQAEKLANVGGWEHDLRDHTLRWSAQFYRMLGLTPGPERMSLEDGIHFIHPDDRERAVRVVEALRTAGQECETELRFWAVDGRERIFHSRAVAEADSAGRVFKIRGMSQDVTERRREERQLRKSEALLAQAESLANMGSWKLEVDTKKLYWSEHYHRMLGLKPEKGPVTYGTGIAMIHPEDRERALRDLESLREGGQTFENELRFIAADGRERIFLSRAVGVADEAGRMKYVRGMSQDVTERRREEQRLRKSEALLSQAEQMANCGSWEVDVKTRKINFSNNLRKMIGIGPDDEAKYESYWDRVHPQDRERAMKNIGEALDRVKPFEHVCRYLLPDGGIRYHFARGMPVAGADGKAKTSMGVVQDITERVQAEENLHNLLRKLLELRDDDRRRLARQLHESVGQTLGALMMSMGRLRESLPESETGASQALWRSCRDLARQAERETREISYSMHPHRLDEAGLGSALRHYASDFADLSGIEVSVDVPQGLARQPREIETTVFRIVQEALTNVHRHSGSRTASVRIACEDGQLRAEVRDDGAGLPANHPTIGEPLPAGVGITGMRERAEQMNGRLEIESTPGRGTAVRVILPLRVTESVGPSV
jgi:PAS domain S-box-containing protein